MMDARRAELTEIDIEPTENQVLVRRVAYGICNGDVRMFRRKNEKLHVPSGNNITLPPQ